jgi:hypothetical protein
MASLQDFFSILCSLLKGQLVSTNFVSQMYLQPPEAFFAKGFAFVKLQ